MKRTVYITFLCFIIFESCGQEVKNKNKIGEPEASLNADSTGLSLVKLSSIDSLGSTIETRILPPINFKRTIEVSYLLCLVLAR